MIKLISSAVVVFMLLIFGISSCSRVPAGEVGVKYNKFGGDKGIQIQELQPGYYFVPPNWDLYTFPTFTQTRVWCNEDSKGDESISFGTSEGLTVNACIGLTYHVDPSHVTKLFQTYRKGIDEITDIYLRNMVRDALVRQASAVGVESVYGVGKAKLLDAVQAEVSAEVAPIGIVIEKAYWTGTLNLPKTVVDSINRKIQATQMAEQRKNEIAQAQAEAQKVEAEATGRANAKLTEAQAEAKAIQLRGDALRNNPGVAELNAIEKWDGHLPQYQLSGAMPFINVPTNK